MEKLWVDKYRPKTLENLDYNQQLTNQLKKLAKSDDFPHLIFYGLNGSGKKTRVISFLHDVYGPSISKLKQEIKEYKFFYLNQNLDCHHIDINPSEVGNQDRLIIQSLLKEVASTHQLDQKTQKHFKVVIINEVDQLTKEAQAALRRTMEKYISKCRLILICENLNKVLLPLRSRCLSIRVPSPDDNSIQKILNNIANRENFKLPQNINQQILLQSERNIRKAILQLQTCKMKFNLIDDRVILYRPEWRLAISSIVKQIKTLQNPQQLRLIRDKLYELLINCINPDLIIKYSLLELIQQNDYDKQQELIYWAAYHENRMLFGQKAIFHIEAFFARVMHIFEKQIETEI